MPDTAYTLTLEVRDAPGVLVRTAQVFGRRGANISQIHVEHPEGEPYSRMTITVHNVARIDQITRQLEKLIDVESVHVASSTRES
jgi:acetolactate synthase-1/3 small subunit